MGALHFLVGTALHFLIGKHSRKASRGTQFLAAEKMLLSAFLDEWIENRKTTVSPNTFLQNEQHVRLYLKPLIGSLLLGKLSAGDVEDLFSKMRQQGHSVLLQRKVVQTLSTAINKAIRQRLLLLNPVSLIEWPRQDAAEKIKAYTQEQVTAILNAAKDDRLFALFVISLDSGARQEELLALEWADLDFTTGTVSITKAVEEISTRARKLLGHQAAGRTRVKTLKTPKSRRTLPLAPQTIEVLRQHQQRMQAEGHGSQLIFCTLRGTYFLKSNLREDTLLPVMTRAGLQNKGWHAFRHTMATALLAAGVSLKVVSERLGHANVNMTLSVYTHVLPNMQAMAVEKIEDIFRQTLPKADRPQLGHSHPAKSKANEEIRKRKVK